MQSPPAQPLHVGRYVLYDEIASGGMAQVRYGRLLGSAGFQRLVAVKRLHPHLASDPEFTAMFLDEARMAARVRHPSVVPTLDVVALEGELLIVMEYVPGESLSRLVRTCMREGQRVPLAVLSAVMASVLHGLHAAHEAKSERGEPMHIVHRDISPQNILVGQDGVARVLDFGIAKAVGRVQETHDGRLKGKPAYMAPEQLSAGQVTRTADVYAAAVVLWEAATGQRLFSGDNEFIVVDQVMTAVVAPPSEVDPGLPRELDAVVLRGLARDPAQRFPTAREMAAALERAVRPAPASEVAEWVERVAGHAMAERARKVLAIESLPPPEPGAAPPAPSPMPSSPMLSSHEVSAPHTGLTMASTTAPTVTSVARSAERARALWLGVSVCVVGLLAAGLLALRSRSDAAPAAPPPPAASSGPAAASADAPSAPPAASSAAPAASAAPAVRATATSTATVRPVPRRDDCSIPFTVAANGRHILKPQCVK